MSDGSEARSSIESGALATIDLSALRANAQEARRLAAGREVIAVVKADAYGHGAVAAARAVLEAGCGRLAVFTLEEAVQLREAGLRAPILVLGGVVSRDEAERAVALRLTVTLHHGESLALAAAAARGGQERLRVHVEVDTGMRRMGVPPEEAGAFLAEVERRDALELEGVFTHFACADDPDLTDCLNQIERFREVLAQARHLGVRPALVHAENSASLMAGAKLREALPEANAVRPGLMLYGARPAPHLAGELRPVMTLRAHVTCLRRLTAGDSVGYGATFRAASPGTRVATLPLGYADGIPWSAGNRGCVWLAGARRRIVGRVSMDSIVVDVGDAPVAVGDEAVIFGNAAEGGISVEEAAENAGTISYDLLVRVGNRVPRKAG
jgi:alanine racemase